MAVITFAHRGGRAHEPENTLRAFRRGLELGAAGLESDVWLSADGHPVLVHDEKFWRGLRHVDVRQSTAADLARYEIPRLVDLFEAFGNDYELSLDLKDPASAAPTVDVLRSHGVPERSWLCINGMDLLADVRTQYPDVRVVHSRRRDKIGTELERHAARLAELGVDAMNMHHTDWNAGLVALFHRFGVRAFAWDAQHVRNLRTMLDYEVDAVYSDRVDRMVATVSEWGD
ncbi:MAG: glycerophosphodiester phosphodiesterase family protein [Acidimicrobiia bacterium]